MILKGKAVVPSFDNIAKLKELVPICDNIAKVGGVGSFLDNIAKVRVVWWIHSLTKSREGGFSYLGEMGVSRGKTEQFQYI